MRGDAGHHMASENQVEANRRNAAKSTGPKTAQGKQVVRMNALKHGLRAERVVRAVIGWRRESQAWVLFCRLGAKSSEIEAIGV